MVMNICVSKCIRCSVMVYWSLAFILSQPLLKIESWSPFLGIQNVTKIQLHTTQPYSCRACCVSVMVRSPPHRGRVLLLVVHGRVSLFEQCIDLLLQPSVLFFCLLQTTQVCVVICHLLTVAFAQSIIFLLYPFKLVHSCVIQLI